MRILIAEDDSRLLTQLDTLLQQNGYSVDLADNGEHALYQLNEFPYDLAIIDIGLPKLDGFDVIRKARQADVSCPVLILTARDRWQEMLNVVFLQNSTIRFWSQNLVNSKKEINFHSTNTNPP